MSFISSTSSVLMSCLHRENRSGAVKFVANFGAGDLLEIAPAIPGEASWYAPFTREVVPEVDIEARRIVVDRPRGNGG